MTFRPCLTLGVCALALAILSGCGSDKSPGDSTTADSITATDDSTPATGSRSTTWST